MFSDKEKKRELSQYAIIPPNHYLFPEFLRSLIVFIYSID